MAEKAILRRVNYSKIPGKTQDVFQTGENIHLLFKNIQKGEKLYRYPDLQSLSNGKHLWYNRREMSKKEMGLWS